MALCSKNIQTETNSQFVYFPLVFREREETETNIPHLGEQLITGSSSTAHLESYKVCLNMVTGVNIFDPTHCE